jgi:adenylylsulfate kinase-like enzyme
MIILFYGQPASGKTTLANYFYTQTYDISLIKIDGDKWRDVTQNKDYSKEGRVRNLKGAFDMALYLEKDDYTPVLSFVTPYNELRDYIKNNAKKLVEIYLTYEEDWGRNANFAKDFEIPADRDCLILNTSKLSLEQCYHAILNHIKLKK